MRPAAFGFALTAFGIIVLLVLPLSAFFLELFRSPEKVFNIEFNVIEQPDKTYTLKSTIVYDGSIPLKDFKVILKTIENTTSSYQKWIKKGDVVEVSIPVSDPASSLVTEIFVSFKIAGIYDFSLNITFTGG